MEFSLAGATAAPNLCATGAQDRRSVPALTSKTTPADDDCCHRRNRGQQRQADAHRREPPVGSRGPVPGRPASTAVGMAVGCPPPVGDTDGDGLGVRVGELFGERVGEEVGEEVGEDVGEDVGEEVGVGDAVAQPGAITISSSAVAVRSLAVST